MDEPTPPEPDAPPPDADRRLSPGAVAFLGLGLACALSLALAAGLGFVVDGWLHTSPLLTLIGLAFGLVAAVLMVVSTIRKYL